MKSIINLRSAPPASKSVSENFSELEINNKNKYHVSDFEIGNNKKSSPPKGEKTSIEPKAPGADYNNNSLFSKFYILNDNNEVMKYPKRETAKAEDFTMPVKKPSVWSQMFCCYVESSKYE